MNAASDLQAQRGRAGQQHDEFCLVLVASEPRWTGLPVADDSLDANTCAGQQYLDLYLRRQRQDGPKIAPRWPAAPGLARSREGRGRGG
jgi:hypothetical protein